MRKITILLVLILSSCSKEFYFQKDQEKISKDLKRISATDQSARYNKTGIENRYKLRTFSTIIDSLNFIGQYGKVSFNFSSLPSRKSQVEKLPQEIKESYLKQVDNADTLMKFVDNINAEKLYKITRWV